MCLPYKKGDTQGCEQEVFRCIILTNAYVDIIVDIIIIFVPEVAIFTCGACDNPAVVVRTCIAAYRACCKKEAHICTYAENQKQAHVYVHTPRTENKHMYVHTPQTKIPQSS